MFTIGTSITDFYFKGKNNLNLIWISFKGKIKIR